MRLVRRIEDMGRVHTGAWSTIAAFLLEPQNDLAKLSMADIADKTFVSKATLTRFAKELGFTGWREFRRAYLEERFRARDAYGNIDVNLPFDADSSTQEIIDSISTLEAGGIRDTIAQLDPAVLDQACALILNARRIAAFGSSPHNHILQILMQRMNTVGHHIEIAHEGEGGAHATTLAPEDCAIMVSYDGSDTSSYPMNILPLLEERGVPIIALTRAGSSLLRSKATVTLTVSSREPSSGTIVNFSSVSSLSCLMDLIYARCFREHFYENLVNRIELAEEH